MTFERWEGLLLFGILIPYTAAVVLAYRRARRDFTSVIGGGTASGGRGLGFSLRWAACSAAVGVALAGLIFAFAGPRWGKSMVERTYRGREVVFCIDISNSMTVSDIGPSRLGKVKDFVRRVVAEDPSMQAGVAVFKGAGELTVPVTGDLGAVAGFVDSLSPGIQTTPGTDIEDGLAEAVQGFPENSAKKGYIFLFTDGESTTGKPLRLTELFRKRNIKLYVFCSGTERGANLRLPSGKIRNTKARPAELQKIVEAFGGEFFSLAAEGAWTAYRSRRDDRGEEGTFTMTETVPRDRYALFLVIAFAAMTAYGVIRIWP